MSVMKRPLIVMFQPLSNETLTIKAGTLSAMLQKGNIHTISNMEISLCNFSFQAYLCLAYVL